MTKKHFQLPDWATLYPGTGWLYKQNLDEYRREIKGRRHKLFTNKYKLFVYARADQMVDHCFNDDVAIVFAKNKTDALRFFKQYYAYADDDHVFEINNIYPEHVHILTDY